MRDVSALVVCAGITDSYQAYLTFVIARQNSTRSEKTKLVCEKLRARLKDESLDIWVVDKDACEYLSSTALVADDTRLRFLRMQSPRLFG